MLLGIFMMAAAMAGVLALLAWRSRPVQTEEYFEDYDDYDEEDEEWESMFDPSRLHEPSDLNNFYDYDVDPD